MAHWYHDGGRRKGKVVWLAIRWQEAVPLTLLPRLISGKLPVADLDIQFPPSMREE